MSFLFQSIIGIPLDLSEHQLNNGDQALAVTSDWSSPIAANYAIEHLFNSI